MFGNKDNITTSQLNEALAPLLKRLGELEKTVKKLKADNKSLKDRLTAIEKGIAATDEKPQEDYFKDLESNDKRKDLESNDESKELEEAPSVKDTVIRQYFLPSPTAEGTFDTYSDEEEIGKSIFALHTQDGEHGTFALLQTPDALATAMISVSQFLKPVCRITGNTHKMPERIETIEEGEAQKIDDKWTVTKKTVIKFE